MTVPTFLRRRRGNDEAVPEAKPEMSGNRRDMFKMLGAGVVGAVGASVLDASSASATEDFPVLAGQTNTATSTTEVITSAGYGLYGVNGSPTGLDSGSGFEAGVFGDSNDVYGVVGFSNNQCGVLGQVGGSGIIGVVGEDSTSSSGSIGVAGYSTFGIGVVGSSIAGTIGGVCGSVGPPQGSGLSGTAGVVGDSQTNDGVTGLSSANNGVSGFITETGENGVYGADNTTGGHNGVHGFSNSGTGVFGQNGVGSTDQSGVYGSDQSTTGGSGVLGVSNAGTGVYGISNGGNGVHGKTNGVNQSGVWGEDYSIAPGGYGVYAYSQNGEALRVDGVASFARSGIATVPAHKTSIQVPGVDLSSSTLILATPQGYVAGIGVAGVEMNVAGHSFTIYLTKALKASSLQIGWFAIG